MIIGIDLGTTNSAVACWREGQPVVLPNSLGDLLTPSAVGLSEDGELLVGRAARDRRANHPKHTQTLFKRLMGSRTKLKLGRNEYSPEELSALVLRSLKADAEAFLGETVSGAVVTVPAYFNDKQRKATRRAGELAGLKVERLISEPTAAALAYGIHSIDDENPFLVFDLGGGTFDVSVVELFEGIIEVRSSAGDSQLGGEDFNSVMIALAREKLGEIGEGGNGDGRDLDEVLRDAAERARREFTDGPEATFAFVWGGRSFETCILSEEFEEAASDLLSRMREPLLRSLRDGKVRVGDLREIILVGGATRMPVVRRAVTRMFGRFPATTIDPDLAVALGAAVQAGLKAGDASLKEVRLVDVSPFSLGVDVGERTAGGAIRTGIFCPIIERNTVVPASRVESFATMQDGQRQIEFNVYQGEAREVSHNVHLGKVNIRVPPKKAGHVSVDCRFSYDASGLLEVDVEVPDTGERRQLVIAEDEDVQSEREFDERRKILSKLKVHPRESDANAAAMARAERCYSSLLAERRQIVGRLISFFQDALDRQDPREIEEARKKVEDALDDIEGERVL